MSHFDTIVAPITGGQRAAVAIVRVSGPDSLVIAKAVFAGLPDSPRARRLYYGSFLHGDEGYTAVFCPPNSFTGELSAEFNIHGAPASVKALVAACLKAGARLAEPGEFTQRAFLNGRIDLTQAEGVRQTVEALTTAQLKAAENLRYGALSERLRSVKLELTSILATLEAHIDFSDELEDLNEPALIRQIDATAMSLEALRKDLERSRSLIDGFRVAIVGLPNAGKSSLFNRLCCEDRAIVTPEPGTTRDSLEALLDLDGIPVLLTDTAGIRESQNAAEAAGIERSITAAERAHMVLQIYDSQTGWTEEDEALAKRIKSPSLRIGSKSDLGGVSPGELTVSSLTGEGISTLLTQISVAAAEMIPANAVSLSESQICSLSRSCQATAAAAVTLQHQEPYDLAVVNLRDALTSLGEITGESASEDLLAALFSQFCIGK